MDRIKRIGLALFLLMLIMIVIFIMPIINIDSSDSADGFKSYSFLVYFYTFSVKKSLLSIIIVGFTCMLFIASFMMILVVLMRPEKKVLFPAYVFCGFSFLFMVLSMISIILIIKS